MKVMFHLLQFLFTPVIHVHMQLCCVSSLNQLNSKMIGEKICISHFKETVV